MKNSTNPEIRARNERNVRLLRSRGSVTAASMFLLAALAAPLAIVLHATPTPSPTLSPLPTPVVNWYAQRGARASGLDPALVRAVIDAESAGDPRAVSHAGAVGMMQLESSTARDCGLDDRFQPLANVTCGSETLARLVDHYGNLPEAIAAYNFGVGNVDATGNHPSRWPQETRRYVAAVIDDYDDLQHESLVALAPTPAPSPHPFAPTASTLGALAASPAVTPAPDPCADRKWSLEHPLRFCGRIRFVPANPVTRDLFYGDLVASLVDDIVSANAQAALFHSYQASAIGVHLQKFTGVACGVNAVTNANTCVLDYSATTTTYAFHGPALSVAAVAGERSPGSIEEDPFMKPFAANFGMYLIGGALTNLAQGALAHALPSLGLRPLSEISQRRLLLDNISAHVAGIESWRGAFVASRALQTATARCSVMPTPAGCQEMHGWTHATTTQHSVPCTWEGSTDTCVPISSAPIGGNP